MDIVDLHGWTLRHLDKINIVLGKNGCGKSTMLRALDQYSAEVPNVGHVAYITPERAGSLVYQAHVEQNTLSSTDSLRNYRRTNQYTEFKQQSVVQFRKLELLVAREVEEHLEAERDGKPSTFNAYLRRVNSLLDEVEVIRRDTAFAIRRRSDGAEIQPDSISSGESELISLGIEALVYEKEIKSDAENILLIDEPDVHLHPDLQVRLMEFIWKQVATGSFRVILATHSTAILGALRKNDGVRVAFMQSGDRALTFAPIDDKLRRILPMFGAHPLSNVFNEAPIVLVEGEDDERIWQQAVRSSRGEIRLYPCVCDSVDQLSEYEETTREITAAVYDHARAYSLRDGDGSYGDLTDDPPIIRLRLQCYSAENLLLTDDVLKSLGVSWSDLQLRIDEWLEVNTSHAHYQAMIEFRDSGYDRRNHKIKALRNDLMGIIGSNKPWEVAVGQGIAQLVHQASRDVDSDGQLAAYLGAKVLGSLIPIKHPAEASAV